MNGIRCGDEAIYIMHLPNRKKPILGILDGVEIRKVAMFDDEESAEIFNELLNKWLGVDDETAS